MVNNTNIIIMNTIRKSVLVFFVLGACLSLASVQIRNGVTHPAISSALSVKDFVCDVTEIVNSFLSNRSNYSSNVSDFCVGSSPYLYYHIDTDENTSIHQNDFNYWVFPPKVSEAIGVSFLVRSSIPFHKTLKWSANQQPPNYFVLHELFPPEFVIYRIIGRPNGNRICRSYYCPTEHNFGFTVYNLITEIKNQSISIGLEYDEMFIDCCGELYRDTLENVKIAILNIQFDSKFVALSYSMFVKEVKRLSERNKEFMRSINPTCSPYLQIKMPNISEEFSSQESHLYRLYILEYAKSWSKRYGKNNTIIIESVPDTIEVTPFGRTKYRNINPVLQLFNAQRLQREDWYELAYSPCQLKQVIETVGEISENLQLDYRHSFKYNSLIEECNHTAKHIPHAPPVYPKLHITNIFQNALEAVDVVQKIEQHSGGIYKVKTIYFLDKAQFNNSAHIEYFWQFMSNRSINVGCSSDKLTSTNLTSVMTQIVKDCESVFKEKALLLFIWPYELKSNNILFLNTAFQETLQVKKEFQKFYPNGEVVFQPNLLDFGIDPNTLFDEVRVMKYNIYCNESLKTVHSFNEIIATWAQIHNFTVNLGSVIDAGERGIWSSIYLNSIPKNLTDFMVLVRRNTPEIIEGGIEFPFTYPCLYYSHTPNSIIPFEINQYAGITFNTSLIKSSKPTIDELQTLLLYMFGKFSNVEIRTTQIDMFDSLFRAFISKFYEALEPQLKNVNSVHLYFEIGTINFLNMLLSDLLKYTLVVPVGIHLSGWENYSSEDNIQISSALEKYMFKQSIRLKFGVSIDNCLPNINFEAFMALTYLDYLTYIVCNIDPWFLNSHNLDMQNMQKFFDLNFYTQQFFKYKFGIDVIFRVNLKPNYCPIEKFGIINYLRFLNDTNQHANAYGVKYFMGEAFSTVENNCQYGWWRINDSSNLAEDAVYTEIESEHNFVDYFSRETKRKLKITPPITNNNKTIIVLSVLFSSALATVVGFAIYYRFKQNRFLSKSEVYAFRMGITVSSCSDDLKLYDIRKQAADAQGFKEYFEIPKDGIQLGNVVGHGNFGIVYKGTLKTNEIVAIKTPPADCSKQTFKTMLAEVKVLCYIGIHSNVLRFIGAYTKEIEKGLIYIVTEYCEGGSLEKYLRSRKVTNVKAYESSSEEESSLEYVANTKINQKVEIEDLNRFSYEIANGMSYIARRKIVHGDLSTRNVLLTGDQVCKIGDFGLSRKLYNKDKYVKQGDEGLPWKWMAIESLNRMEFTTKSDVWSFGVTIWEIFTLGDIPYHGIGLTEDFNKRLENGMRLSKPPLATEETYTKMLLCWNTIPDKRPDFFTLSSYFYEKIH